MSPQFRQTVHTTCPYCGVGCGVLATVTDAGVKIQGDPDHPSNFGRLCSKGSALGETLSLDTRLLHPEIGGIRTGWDEALDTVAGRFRETLERYGPDSVAFYVSGQLLTEDYYVANKLMKGFIGSANIDTNSRLCMSSTVAGHKRAFGEDLVPGCYEDLELADLVVLVGSNTAWCHPVLFQRILAARRADPKRRIVCIDPRRTATAEAADLHLPIRPGTDVLLFNGLLHYLRHNDCLDFEFIERHTEGYAAALNMAKETAPTVPSVAAGCGLAESEVARFYRLFAANERTVTLWSQGVNQSTQGTDKVNAILNVHLATGRIGKPGAGPFSLTGQPNAMGGREVGGLANQLAAHLDLDDPGHRRQVQEFWRSPRIADRPGYLAVDLFRAIGEGRIRAVWIMATNPAVSLPDVHAVRRALSACPFVVVSDCERDTDLSRFAHVQLPALAWGEKDGTVTNSERRISRQRAFLDAPGEARPDWWIITEVARRMGFGAAFDYRSAADIFAEHIALSRIAGAEKRRFDLSGLQTAYDELAPTQWPVDAGNPQGTPRLSFDGRLTFVAVRPRAPAHAPDAGYPLILNTGRIRDQWHTMTRTGKTPRLTGHLPEPFAEVHPIDGSRLELTDGALARLESRYGSALVRVRFSAGQQPGTVFTPMHWSESNSRQGLVNALVNPAVDPVSGEPEFKHTPVRVMPYRPRWYGFAIARRRIEFPDAAYRVVIPARHCWRHELAGEVLSEDWQRWARERLGPEGDGWDDWLEFADPRAGRYRCAWIVQGRIEFALFVSPSHELPPRDWLVSLFGQDALSETARAGLLAGRPLSADDDRGRIVCACFAVGENTLRRTIASETLTTAEQVGTSLKAGTNCGSCLPEIHALLAEAQH
ncbi:nitrate reductase [Methylococcus capsulatus]|uniref:nitrate reductase n=1 Tax=Methylococcus capsulatus TaxID=414 RepID=UPI002FD94D4A